MFSDTTYRTGIFSLLLALAVFSQTATTTTKSTTPKPPKCPYPAPCVCSDNMIDCSGKNLYKPPVLSRGYTPGYYVKVDLSNNRMSSLVANQLPANITHLDLGNNPIRTVSSEAFADSLETLKELRFSKSSFKEIPAALGKLVSLESLEISGNNVTTWTADVFKLLGYSLRSLDISNTAQTKWPEFIKYLPSLKSISLGGNPIKTIPRGVFEEWERRLEHLNVSNTGIANVDFLAELFSLKTLDLSQNIISNHVYLSYHLISLSRSLKSLNISQNRLATAPRLAHLINLVEVDISNNSISTFEPSTFPSNLRTLILDYNRLSSMPKTIRAMTSLYRLSIRHNSLREIAADSFPYSGSLLINLNLAGNPITYISQQSFVFLSRLQLLDLSDTKLHRLPVALSSLRALTELRIENVVDISCWCDANSISAWYNYRKSQLNIIGSCTDGPISSFLENYREYCG